MQDYKERALKDYNTFLVMKKRLEPLVGKLNKKVILDVGCGRRYPYTLLLNSLGNIVVGIDLDYVNCKEVLLKRYWKELKRNGLMSFARALIFDLFGQKRTYYKKLQEFSNFPLNYEGLIFKQMNVESMTFP